MWLQLCLYTHYGTRYNTVDTTIIPSLLKVEVIIDCPDVSHTIKNNWFCNDTPCTDVYYSGRKTIIGFSLNPSIFLFTFQLLIRSVLQKHPSGNFVMSFHYMLFTFGILRDHTVGSSILFLGSQFSNKHYTHLYFDKIVRVTLFRIHRWVIICSSFGIEHLETLQSLRVQSYVLNCFIMLKNSLCTLLQ